MTNEQLTTTDLPAQLEALIFASATPLSISRMIEILHAAGFEVDARDIKAGLKILISEWQNPQRSHGRGLQFARNC